MNFRKVLSVSSEDLYKSFNSLGIQISFPFIKDIVSRFATYYGRQGQPDFNRRKLYDKFQSIMEVSHAK